MIQTVPQVAETGLYNISEAARALGITRKTMRKYADGGFIAFHVRRVNSLRATLNISKLKINKNMAYIFYFLGVATGIAVYRFYITHKNMFDE